MSLSYSCKPVSSSNSNVQRSWTMKQKRAKRWCFLYRDVPSLLCKGLGRGEMESAPMRAFFFFLSFFLFFYYCYFLWIPSGSLCQGEGDVPTIFGCVADALNILYRGLYKWFRRVRGPTKRGRYYLRAWRRVYLSGLNLPSIDQVQYQAICRNKIIAVFAFPT